MGTSPIQNCLIIEFNKYTQLYQFHAFSRTKFSRVIMVKLRGNFLTHIHKYICIYIQGFILMRCEHLPGRTPPSNLIGLQRFTGVIAEMIDTLKSVRTGTN
jgi:hypothetical protein